MIIYKGSKKIDGVNFLIFNNDETNKTIEIPVEQKTFDQFSVYFNKLCPPKPKPIEWGNDEEPM